MQDSIITIVPPGVKHYFFLAEDTYRSHRSRASVLVPLCPGEEPQTVQVLPIPLPRVP